MKSTSLGLFAALLLLSACGSQNKGHRSSPDDRSAYPVISEAYMTDNNKADDVDSPTIWHGQNGEHWIISVCKTSDRLLVHDALTGSFIRAIGVSGSGPGQFNRPNSVAAVDEYAIVVERDNHRLQVFHLPEWTVLGSFGDSALIKPYGLAVTRDSVGYRLYVTDNYETPDEGTPHDSELGRRVKVLSLTIEGKNLTGTLLSAFGATEGDGVLHNVESIFVDTARGRIFIADEGQSYRDFKIYDMDGQFCGMLGSGVFRYQPEGIVMYSCPNGSGYYICVDQDVSDNTFQIFDRATLEHLGAFAGVATTNSDGIALTQEAFGEFPEGAFVAVNNDGGIAAFDWKSVADTLKLEHRCPPVTEENPIP